MQRIEIDKLLEVRELRERIDALLLLIKEKGETVKLIEQGEVVARMVPPKEHEGDQQKRPESRKAQEQELKDFWDRIDQLANEIGTHAPEHLDAVQIVREGRREL